MGPTQSTTLERRDHPPSKRDLMSEKTEELELFAEGTGRIRPRARLLRTIGAELISSEVVAVIELVRNSYDADATVVQLVFDRPEDPASATLEIRDNGHGMTRDILLGPWLEPATDHKSGGGTGATGGERSPRGRRRLGSKGVGRFAAQRIGRKLDVRTRSNENGPELSAFFDWEVLEQGKYLDELSIPWREHSPTHVPGCGTYLNISKLHDRWSPERFERLRVGLSRLVSPTIEEDFSIAITINGSYEKIAAAVDLEDAMYSVAGTVHEGGSCTIRYRDINGASEDWERTVLWPDGSHETCGPFSFVIGAWDLDTAPLRHFLKLTRKKVGIREFRRAMKDHSGIALYRDGFRILPYGEPDNDWLRLDRRRVNNPTMRLSNNQMLGRIMLSADHNPHLHDQTNREGLVSNEAYSHLQEVVLELLGFLETRRFSARRVMDVDWQRRTSSLPAIEDGEVDRITSLLKSMRNGDTTGKSQVGEVLAAFERLREASADTIRHYAGAATAGQLAGLVFRQLRHPVRQVRSDLDLAVQDLNGGVMTDEDLEDVRQSLQSAIQHIRIMEERMEKIDPLAFGGGGRRVTEVSLGEALQVVIEAYREELDTIGVFVDFKEGSGRVIQTNREIAQQVFSNLLDNALYWAPRGEARDAVVAVELTPSGFTIEDTGPGIPAGVQRAIFEPHFTTRDGAKGLGLTLVKDLLKTIGGQIKLTNPESARFSVDLAEERN
jgi:signal transduction histidine kinase